MKPIHSILLPLLLTTTLTTTFANAAPASPPPDFGKMTAVALVNGPNTLDLNGDGKKDMVFVAWRENFNAHGYTLFSFYLDLASKDGSEKRWNLMPIHDEARSVMNESVSTQEGADCKLRDIRLLLPRNNPKAAATLVVAQRASGESFADAAAVTFTVYEVKRNKDSDPGEPPFYFHPKGKIKAKKNYCDVGEAFEAELGIVVKTAY
jgi:hypothetical protein